MDIFSSGETPLCSDICPKQKMTLRNFLGGLSCRGHFNSAIVQNARNARVGVS
jgi:hypothetical protein